MSKKTRRAKARRALLTLSLVLVMMMVAVGGTIAWLTASTGVVTNTFAPSSVSLTLQEHEYDPDGTPTATGFLGGLTGKLTSEGVDNYQMIPGSKLSKDPFVTIGTDSEDCYVFVEVTKSANYDTFFTELEFGDEWGTLSTTGNTIVIYYDNKTTAPAVAEAADVLQNILKDNMVTVDSGVTSEDMAGLTSEANYPSLTFKAYAVQALNQPDTTAAALWDLAKPAPATGN